MRALLTIVASDLRRQIRDRSVIVFGLAVPLALVGLLSLMFSGFDDGPDLDPVSVGVSVPEGDEVAGLIPDVLGGLDEMEVDVREMAPDLLRDAVEAGEVSVAVEVPDGFGDAVRSAGDSRIRIVVGDESLETLVVVAVVEGIVEQLSAGALAGTAAALGGVPAEELAAIGEAVGEATGRMELVEGEVSDQQLSLQAGLVVGQAGMFLFFSVGFGVLALIYEREQGTLVRLGSLPLRPGTVVAAKAVTGLLLGIVTTSVLLVAGSLLFDVSFGAVLPVGLVVVCAVVAVTSLVFVVAKVAATSEQATLAQSVLAMGLGVAGGAFFPLRIPGLVGRLLELNPVAALIRGLGITSGGGGVADLGVPLAILIGFAAVAALAALVLPDRTAGR